MSSVPYTFANNTGNIPLSELDANFANCKAFADTAGLVTANTQTNITSVGILTGLTVSGNTNAGNILTSGYLSVAGNVTVAGDFSVTGNTITVNTEIVNVTESVIGNIIGGNIQTGGSVDATGNITGGNILTAGSISATGNITVDQLTATGNITSGNILTSGSLSATGNITSGNSSVVGSMIRAKDVEIVNYANITATGTYSLSTSSSINVLIANNTGYTATLNMPASPADGQICNFAISGNTVTLALGTGTVLPTFAGSATIGTGYRYVYRQSDTSWYRIG